MNIHEKAHSLDDDTVQQALLESIRQNGRLLDELQAARRREDALIDRVMQLEEDLRRQCSTSIEAQEDRKDGETSGTGSKRQNGEELVEWNRVPHYDIIVNGSTLSEGFVANNSAVCFIRPEVVKRAKLQPYKVNPPARFKFSGIDDLIGVVPEAVMVPLQIGDYRARYPMFIYDVRSEIILGANWLHNEPIIWQLTYMLVGPNKIRVNPKPPIMVKKSDPRASMVDEPVIIQRLS